MSQTENILEVRNLKKYFKAGKGTLKAVDDVSFFIKKGETLSDDNLAVKRPGTGITPMRWEEIVGTKAIKDYQPDEQIQL